MGDTREIPHLYARTVYSDNQFDPDARAKPSKADIFSAASYRDMLEMSPPGTWSDNRMRQVEHFRSVPYVAIRAIMDLVGGASYILMRRNWRRAKSIMLHNGRIVKATPQGMQDGRDEDYVPFDDYDHPLVKLVTCPNPNESIGEFIAKVVLQNRLTGVGPVWAVGSEQNPQKPVQLWSLRTPFIYPLYQNTKQYPNGAWLVNPYRAPGWIGGMPVGIGTAGAVIPGEDVKRFLDPHPIIDWDGFSPLTAGAVQLDVFDSVEVSRKSAMDRGLSLDTVIVAPGMSKESVDALRQGLEARHMGADKSRRVAVLAPEVGMAEKFTVQTNSMAAREMDYANGWEQTLKFVLSLFGVPPIVAGLGESGSYAEGYAARQQFYDRQEDYLGRLAVWFTREFCSPWESHPGEYLLRIKPRPIDDKDMAEKKHNRQCQTGTITLNESRAKDDLPPLPYGDDLLPVALAKQQQQAAPPEVPGMGGGPEGGGTGSTGGAEDDGVDVPDEMTAAALEELGVPQEAAVAKAGRFEESKHKRDHGKFSSTQGASGTAGSEVYASKHNPEVTYGNESDRDADDRHFDRKIAATGRATDKARAALAEAEARQKQAAAQVEALRQQLAAANQKVATAKQVVAKPAQPSTPSPRVAQVAQRAKSSPAVKEQLTRAHEWAERMAEMHADRVAKHLGIDRASAKHVLASTIKMLCDRALRGEGDAQSMTYTGAGGQKLKIGVKKKTTAPASGDAHTPRPTNAQGRGSLAPVPKSMGELVGSAGGFLVAPQNRLRKRKRRNLKSVLGRVLKSLRS